MENSYSKQNILLINFLCKGEENRIREKLIEAYGQAIFSDDAWETFHDWQIMLRKDKPEVLFMTKKLGEYYKVQYFGQ